MNPNNNNLDYLLKLPTPRLLSLYRKVRGQVCNVDYMHWEFYQSHKEELANLPKGKELPKHTYDPKSGRSMVNQLYWAKEVEKLVELEASLKKELDTREHVLRTK